MDKRLSRILLVLSMVVCLPLSAVAYDGGMNVEGFMAGVEVSQAAGTVGVAVGGRYWGGMLGMDFTLGGRKTNLEAANTDIIDATEFGVGVGGLIGIAMNQFKPHLRVGFSYSYADDGVANADGYSLEINPSIGLDVRAAEHLVIGATFISFPFILTGEVGNVDLSGYSIDFLNSLRVAYLF